MAFVLKHVSANLSMTCLFLWLDNFAIDLTISSDCSAAFLYPASIVEGEMPKSNNFSAFSSKEPASITTDIVPSPTSLSTEFEASIITLAAGCSTSSLRNIVEPFLVIVTSPKRSMYIFSNPLGPNELLMRSAINFPASKLYLLASSLVEYFVPSLSKSPTEFM